MQIARVVPKTRTQKIAIFDYAIPPELLPFIQIGILVEIPFHGRKLAGIVVELKRSSVISRLSPLISIIDPEPVVDKTHIQLAEWMSKYYLAPLGKTLFENIVPPAKRTIKKNLENKKSTIFSIKTKNTKTHQYHKSKRYLIVSDFSHRLKFYLQAINKTLTQNKSVIILIPDLFMLHFFTKALPMPYCVIHSKMTPTQRWLEWEKIRQGKCQIVIGSKSALFVPTPNLGLIIIDQEENETYKNDRSPRFHAVKTAEILSNLTGVNLLLGSLTPSIESYFLALKNIFILKKTTMTDCTDITIVNNTQNFQTISHYLQEKIEENLNLNQKIILVLNRKGEGKKYVCPDCRWTALCQECNLPLVIENNKLSCFRCGKSNSIPQECPKCQNVHLKSFGITTNKLAKFIQDFWPKARLIRLEEGENSKNFDQAWDIAIVTTYALKFQFPSIGLVGIIDADQGFNFPDYKSNEKNFQTLFKFLKLAKQGIIQTNLENNPIIEAASQLDYEKFFLNELETRRQYGFPPFFQLIRLLYKDKNEQKAKSETKNIYLKIEEIISKQKNSKILNLGPAPTFFKKKRGYYCFQIIIKIPLETKKDEILILNDFLKTLPKDWIIDVDPVDLL